MTSMDHISTPIMYKVYLYACSYFLIYGYFHLLYYLVIKSF